jgi:intracellular septation protein
MKFLSNIKIIINVVSIISFFLLYKYFNLDTAVYALVFFNVIEFIYKYFTKKKISNFELLNIALIVVFGSLSIFTHDTKFIKIKPTILYALTAIVLLLDFYIIKKFYLQKLYTSLLKVEMTIYDKLMKKIYTNIILSFLGLSVLNEIIWRFTSENLWINYKLFVTPILIFIIIIAPIKKIKASYNLKTESN